MRLFNKVKNMIRAWFDITPVQKNIYYLNETFSFESNAVRDRIWMRDDLKELDESYKQLPRDSPYFRAASPHIKICKIHSSPPALMVQVLTDIAICDLSSIGAADWQLDWDETSKDNEFDEMLRKAIKDALFIGDDVLKISFDTKLPKYPIIEPVPGDKVEIVYERGHFIECALRTEYRYAHKRYMLYEHYGEGYAKNISTEWSIGDLLPLSTIPQTAKLIDVTFVGRKLPSENGGNEVMRRFAMTVPSKIKDSIKWENRGEDIFGKETSSFDGLGEIISQWADAVRTVRAKRYISGAFIPRDPEIRWMSASNQHDSRFLMIEGNMQEKDKNQTDVA